MKYLICAILTLVLTCSQAIASTVGFSSTNTVVQAGEIFSIDIIGNGFTQSTDGGGINITFETPSIVDFLSVTIDPIWEFFSDPGTINNANGSLTDISFATFSNRPPEDFKIATVFFQAGQTPGSSGILLSESFALGGFSLNGTNQSISFSSAGITVVPIPPAIILFLSGLAALGFPMLRRSKSKLNTAF